MRPRLLPLVIAVAALTLLVRLGALLHDFEAAAQETKAQETKAQTQAAPTQATPAPATAAAETPAPEAMPGAAAEGGAAPVAGTRELLANLPADPFSLTDEEIELLQALGQRREEIERRASEVETRAGLLAAAEARIDEKVARLEQLEKTIQGLLVTYDEQKQAQIQSLVKIYETMKPKDAARIFEQLEMDVLLEVVGRMSERKTAPVLAEMNPEKAKTLTIELAQRQELPIARE